MIPPLHEDLDFNCPLSSERADRLLDHLGPLAGNHVVDLGCGWGELLLRAAARGAVALGIDQDADAIAHARASATARGVTAAFETGDATAWTGTADVIVVNGSTHIWSTTEGALNTLRGSLRPAGRLLMGECYWRTEPTTAQLAEMPMTREEYGTLPQLVDLALTCGYRPLHIAEASPDEWNDFQSRHALGYEKWLAANPTHPEHAAITTKADNHRRAWLHGWHGVLGMAYLILWAPPMTT
ncbi:class I SAM-dependent methyltransferase [Actinokineospora guangxiensis]|uniref:Class I SAM-dependent methyltransferase n=1 Tax=Actinokineospora guangxiensis TaxID=1490288 RepID=A0ABW0EV22_9PSEU